MRPVAAQRGTVRGEFFAGARFLWRTPVLRQLTLLLSVLTFLTYGITDAVIYRLKHELDHPDTVVGYVLTVATVGTFVASAVVARVRGRLGFGPSWIGAFILAGLAVSGLGAASTPPAIGGWMAIMLLGTGVAGICSITSIRRSGGPRPTG